MKKIYILIALLSLVLSSGSFAANEKRYQFNLNAGQDVPQTGSGGRGAGNAVMAKFALSTKTTALRLVNAFTLVNGAGLRQGEFSIGPHIYPFNMISNAPVLPYAYAEGLLGLGFLNQVLRLDTGYCMGVGIDFNFFADAGLTFAVEHHEAAERSYRLWVGFTYQSR